MGLFVSGDGARVTAAGDDIPPVLYTRSEDIFRSLHAVDLDS
jgi:hypothetical protein